MRLATEKDIPAIDEIALKTLRLAYPDADIPGYGGLMEQFIRKEVIIAVLDDVSAFILSERLDPDHWWVRFLMPLDMFSADGKGLISFAFIEENKVRPMKPTTECFAHLNQASAVERATADSYKIFAGTDSRQLTDAKGVVQATEIFISAADLILHFAIPVVLSPAAVKP